MYAYACVVEGQAEKVVPPVVYIYRAITNICANSLEKSSHTYQKFCFTWTPKPPVNLLAFKGIGDRNSNLCPRHTKKSVGLYIQDSLISHYWP
jgi:hypothetical protein